MATDDEIGARLMRAREAKGLSREQLATRVGVSVATIQHHENGVRSIRRAAAESYKKVLKFSIEWLFTGTGAADGVPEEDEGTAEIIGITKRLDRDDRSKVAEFARFLAEQAKRRS